MWMKIKAWLYRRGLGWGPFYSPSAAMIWRKGTIFHPGKLNFHDLGDVILKAQRTSLEASFAGTEPRCSNCGAKPGDPVVCTWCPDDVRDFKKGD